MIIGTITAKGQTTVPADIRAKLNLKPGDKVYWIFRNGQAVLMPKNRHISELAGMFYDPTRKPAAIEEINEAIRDAAAESGMAGLGPRHDRT